MDNKQIDKPDASTEGQYTKDQNNQSERLGAKKQRTGHRKLGLKSSIKVLLRWRAPERIWEPKSQVWYLSSAIVILIAIFIFIRLSFLVGVIAMVAFMLLWFIQGYLEPLLLEHKITNRGLYTHSKLFHWDQMSYFWFAQKDDQLLLHVDFPKASDLPRLTILVPDHLEMNVFDLMIEFVNYGEKRDVEYTFFSKYLYGEYVSVSRYIPDLDQPEYNQIDFEETK